MDIQEQGSMDDIYSIMVSAAYTTSAHFMMADDDTGEPSGEVVTLLETRVFTVDGKEHHLLWPIEAALPLLQAIMNVAISVIGGPEPEHMEIPDTIEGMNDGYEGDSYE